MKAAAMILTHVPALPAFAGPVGAQERADGSSTAEAPGVACLLLTSKSPLEQIQTAELAQLLLDVRWGDVARAVRQVRYGLARAAGVDLEAATERCVQAAQVSDLTTRRDCQRRSRRRRCGRSHRRRRRAG